MQDLTENRAACVIGSAVTDANEGLGRIVRDSSGGFVRIVEHKDATPDGTGDPRDQHGLLRLRRPVPAVVA